MDTAAAIFAPRMVDERARINGTCYTLERVYKTDRDTIRVSIIRDFYDFQSSAIAEVLNSDRHFTGLVDESASEWHDGTEPATAWNDGTEPATAWNDNADRVLATAAAVLGPVADRLLARAVVILA